MVSAEDSPLKNITTESFTLVQLLLSAIERVPTQLLFDRDPYEARRTALKGSRLLKVLAFFQLCAPPSARGLLDLLATSDAAQKALGGTLARNTLSNALAHYDLDLLVEAWLLLHRHYSSYLPKLGKPFVRLAAVDASLIKLSLQGFDWATYRKKTGAAKMTCIFDWVQGIPRQFVFTAAGKVHDLKAAAALSFSAGWTYIFDRGYFGFDFLQAVVDAGAHFVIRLKRNIACEIVALTALPTGTPPTGVAELILDATIKLTGWDTQTCLRLVMYQLTDGTVISVLTTRHDLCAYSIVRMYKERWTIENWWRWIKRLYKIKEPLGRSENALPLQIVAAFVTDLLLRVCKHAGGFKETLYAFIRTARLVALVPANELKSAWCEAFVRATQSLTVGDLVAKRVT
jgi:hypothetical protein